MSPEEFKKIWTIENNNLNPINLKSLNGLGLSKESIDFLIKSGLPDSCAPFLSFSKNSDDIYDSIQKLTSVYDYLESDFDKYIIIGSCSDGDPIVINTKNGNKIECLDHENDFAPDYFNSDISSLAKCLIVYRNFVTRVQKENGENALLESDFTDNQFEELKSNLFKADLKSMENNGFWLKQIEMDFEMREYERNEK